MTSFRTQNNHPGQICHLDPQLLSFSVFSTEEIKKLCVKNIHSPLTFDNFGHPFPGGLYDKALGPYNERSEQCGTCFQNINFCPGHFGYIELPLPVVNAMFFKFITDILRLACCHCFRLQIPVHIKTCLSIQMKLINCGLITEAMNMQDELQSIMSGENALIIPDKVKVLVKNYKRLIKKADPKVIFNQNIERVKSQLLDQNYLRELSRKSKSCLYCKKPKGVFKTLKNKIFAPVEDTGPKSVKVSSTKIITPQETMQYLRNVWENDAKLLKDLAPILTNTTCEWPTDLCFFSIIPVTPPLVRPTNFVAGRILENEQTQVYREILDTCVALRIIIRVVKSNDDIDILKDDDERGAYKSIQGSTGVEKLNIMWENLQRKVDFLIDKEKNIRSTGGQGLKQVLEKKEGLVRMHMMGKRVNFSARSVITPDPYLNIEEIGIPEAFAMKLSYPTPVNHLNVVEMRQMVINGPNVHPGAIYVEFESGSITKLSPTDLRQRESIAKILLTPEEKGFVGIKKVHRHLCNGDVVLLNRQPTLHRPSIMAHIVRVLKNEKTLRLHYANCKAYNADFDGDEMNVHFPQNDVSRSEGYSLAQVSYQYLSPKDGTPLSGLIQDHVIAGVHLSLRGKFFTKESYQQLVFQGLPYKTSEVKLLLPAIIKPVALWSGKQVLSTLIINLLPEDKHLINLTSSAKISSKAWNKLTKRSWLSGGTDFATENEMSETEVVIRKGELLVGVLDKAQYGATAYGLIHCVYELYGGTYGAKLLSAFSKLFTYYLQREGFTLSVNDILVRKKADKMRNEIIDKCRTAGKGAISEALNVSEDAPIDVILDKLEEASFRNNKMRSIIDGKYKQCLDKLTNEINKTCLPAGLICNFPENNLQLMVQSGAKGSTVNTMQISCLLGQIELEGKRPPVMISGKSLPSFPIFDFSPRAGGFIDGRFMTGIQPPEFFFHCMAGREGLIDTAVKTSRSGYLQRCLVKLLEGIKVCYDMTVRDSDGSIIQFLYGEDGMDVTKFQFLNKKHLKFLIENADTILNKETIKILKEDGNYKQVDGCIKELDAWRSEFGDPLHRKRETPFKMFSEVIKQKLNLDEEKRNKIDPNTGRIKSAGKIEKIWRVADENIKKQFNLNCRRCPDPINANLKPDIYFGSLTDKLSQLMNEQNPYEKKRDRKKFENMFKLKAMESLCSPGEAVGLLAAQSIGEPSTQMTLNTFHFAGRGDMNVTLGIPRIREILMEASKTLKTPAMEIPFLDIPNLEKKAEKLRKFLTRVTVADVLVNIEVEGDLEIVPFRQWCYTLKFNFLPHFLYKSKYDLTPKRIIKHMQKSFVRNLFSYMKSQLRIQTSRVTSYKKQDKEKSNEEGEEEKSATKEQTKNGEESEEEDNTEDAKMTHKYEQEHEKEEVEKFESDLEEGESDDDKEQDPDEVGLKPSQTSYNTAQTCNYDEETYLWFTIQFCVPVSQKKLDFSAILREVASSSVISETPGINKAIVYEKDGKLTLRTDGCNIPEMFKYDHLLDLNKLYSNDIHKIAEIYGIEAANRVVAKEVKEVFGPYSITVDDRHLTLVADCMTSSGTFKPLNRMGISSCASPLQQVSFESSLKFLREAIITGKMDQLKSPSSCLVTGKPCQVGTGSFNLLNKLPL